MASGIAGPKVRPCPRRTIRQAGNCRSIEPVLWDSHFMRAARGEATSRTPVWLMRQAGRYMAEYRAVRKGRTFLDMCYNPDIAAKVTIEAQAKIDADAAIIFADILLILDKLGQELTFAAGEGPRLNPPIRSADDLKIFGDALQAAKDCSVVADACAMTREQLPAEVPLIGFCGAPFTVASYAIEGQGSRQFAQTRLLMYNESAAWHQLMETLVDALAPYLIQQVEAGAHALQIFDSWVGHLNRMDYQEFVLPHVKRLVSMLPEGIPLIYFGTNTGHLLEDMISTGIDVIGLDHTMDLAKTWKRFGGGEQISVQGNLDPALLLADKERLLKATDEVLAAADGKPGFIFNLGHGILKETNVQNVIDVIDHIHNK